MSSWSVAQMTTERCHRAACHLCPRTCEWQQGRKTSASNRRLKPGSCTDSVCVGDLSGSQDLSVSPEVRKVCSHFVQEEALRDARVGWGGRADSPHSIYLTGKIPCQQVKILVPTLSLYPGATFSFPFGCFGLFERQNKPTYVGSSKDQNSRRFDGYQ